MSTKLWAVPIDTGGENWNSSFRDGAFQREATCHDGMRIFALSQRPQCRDNRCEICPLLEPVDCVRQRGEPGLADWRTDCETMELRERQPEDGLACENLLEVKPPQDVERAVSVAGSAAAAASRRRKRSP